MPTERINFDSEEDWLDARTKDITSTDVAALPGFDVSPYLSPWELFQRKVSGEVPAILPNERMKWGTRLQDAVARGVAEDTGLNIRRLNAYLRDPDLRVGSSFDFEILSHADGPGIMEIKNVDSLVFRDRWQEDGDFIEAPPHIELQLQHQLLVSGRPWGMLVALVGGNTIKTARRERDEEVGRIILRKVAEFWIAVRENRSPDPDFSRDAKAIARLYSKSEPGLVLDARNDAEMASIALQYEEVRERERKCERAASEFRAMILSRIGLAEKVIGDGWTISAKQVADNPGKVITQEMVGQTIGARAGYRNFRVTMKKEG